MQPEPRRNAQLPAQKPDPTSENLRYFFTPQLTSSHACRLSREFQAFRSATENSEEHPTKVQWICVYKWLAQIDLFKAKISDEQAQRVHKALGPDGSTGFTERINITFRFYRPDFTPDPLPSDSDTSCAVPPLPRCKCDAPCILRPDMRGKLSPDASTPYVRMFFELFQK